MKISGTTKIFPIIATTVVASLATILLINFFSTPEIFPGAPSETGRFFLADSVPVKKKGQDSINNALIISGDTYFKAKDYLNAKAAYQQAVSQNPADEVAKEKLRKTLELLRSQKAQNILFDVAVASADKLFQAGDYTKAMQEYENASKLLPGDPYPKNKINEIIKIQADNQMKEQEYAKAIASADKFYTAKNYQESLLDYKKALTFKPSEKYPQDRITELTGLIAKQKAIDEAYNKAIILADNAFKAVQYTDAIKSYRDALAIKPEQTYPKDRIREIEAIMARIAKAQADYDQYITLADSFYIDKKYLKARENYLMATAVKPAEAYPKEMLAKADKMLTGQEAAMAKALDEQYTATLSNADKLFADNSYEPARAEYLKASNLKPAEQYPKDKIAEIGKIFENAMKDKEEQYKTVVAAADKAFTNKVYDISKAEYQRALTIKPTEAYPKTRIAEIDKLVAALALVKAADARYANSIGKADSLFTILAYQEAKAEFQNALRMKPSEVYPKDKIAEINSILADREKQKQKDAQYNALITKADNLFNGKSYLLAKTEYTNASGVKPAETYPKERILEIAKILNDQAEQKAIDDRYLAAIATADKLLASKTYDQARTGYEQANLIKPAEQYPKDKIAEIEKALAALAAQHSLDENYKSIIDRADGFLAAKTYATAKKEYEAALALKPNEQYPKQKISEIDAQLAAIAQLQALDDSYASTIAKADKLLANKSWEAALAEYQGAAKLKPNEEYPKNKISEITIVLADLEKQKSLDAQYTGWIAKADKSFGDKSYAQSKTEYTNALSLKPQESYPKDQIALIDKALADLAAIKALNDKYAATISAADKLLQSKSYEPAKSEYQNALAIKPGEPYPAGKIADIEKILADLAAARSLDENYAAAIASADKLLADKRYESAKSEYQKAAALKPQEKYPQSKIAEIDFILTAIANQKALDEEYAGLIASGDKFLSEKDYLQAKTQFQSALKLKSGEQYPKDKITDIDKTLAELARLKDIDDRYSAFIAEGDKLLAEKSYSSAKSSFQNALGLKPKEIYPKDKIAEIDATLAALASAKALDDQYAGKISSADKLLAAKSYDQAKAEYQTALKLKPSETYPTDKINEIARILDDIAALKALEENYKVTIGKADQLLLSKSYELSKAEYEKALTIKPAEQYPKSKIAEIDLALAAIARQKALDDEYAGYVANGDKYLNEKSFEQAKTEYQKAIALKASEQYPKTKLSETEKALAEIARLKALDDQYAAAIGQADKLLSEKSYDQAKLAYNNALTIKPSEQYPKDKIAEIGVILDANAKQKALDEQYKLSVSKADQLLAEKSYVPAKTEYSNALNLKPAEQYPKDKISEIDAALAVIKAREDAYNASISAADKLLSEKKFEESRLEYQNSLTIKPSATYPKDKISEINRLLEELMGKQKYYEKIVADADNALKEKDYLKAKEGYQQALGVLPEQTYPQTQINIITARMDSLYRANKTVYDKAVSDGDRYYNNYEFDKAVDAYTEASNYLPMEKYPREMIVKIRRTIAENAIADVLKSTVVITSNSEKQFSFTPVNIASRKNNFVYIKIKNLSGKPFNVLMRYGKDKQANGGVVLKNLNIDGKVIERLVSVRDQDLWSREDNNWISLYPQGGDIEVSFIQVSRAK